MISAEPSELDCLADIVHMLISIKFSVRKTIEKLLLQLLCARNSAAGILLLFWLCDLGNDIILCFYIEDNDSGFYPFNLVCFLTLRKDELTHFSFFIRLLLLIKESHDLRKMLLHREAMLVDRLNFIFLEAGLFEQILHPLRLIIELV